MPALSLPSKDIEKQIKDKQLAPVYLLWGEEDFFIDRLTALFETQLLDEMQKEFDFSLYFAPDLKSQEPGLKGVMANCKQFPVMSPFQVVIIKEAQSPEPHCGDEHQYHINVVKTAEQQAWHEDGKYDYDTSHARHSDLGNVEWVYGGITRCLADLLALEKIYEVVAED